MIEEEIPKDVSLLRCTVKKSQQVLAKVVLLVSYAIVALALLGCGLITGVLIPNVSPIIAAIIEGIWKIVAVLLSIPWYYYVASVAILAIPVYSFLWCIARELTEEDWNSKEAKSVACVVAAVAIAVGVVDSKLMRFPGACLHYWRRMRK